MEQNFCKNILEMFGLIYNGEVGGRTHFAERFNVTERSISSYISYLREDLKVQLHYDKKSSRYIIDEYGLFGMIVNCSK